LQYDKGEHTYGDIELYTYSGNSRLHVGDYCSIANNVTVIIGGEHRYDTVTSYPLKEKKFFVSPENVKVNARDKGDTYIGNDCWLGHGTAILSGSHIGDGAVIGAYSLVTGRIPPYAIATGNRAQVVGYRFTERQIAALLRIKWWEWSEDKVKENAHLLSDNDIDFFIEMFDV
jgi:acetyltransferase-like isoleucine patch superfamily enzyme